MYVVAIDALKDDIEGTDYKAFESLKDAQDRFFRAWAMIQRRKPVFDGRRLVQLSAARLYEVDAPDPRAAIVIVQRGLETPILDTDFADLSIDLEELLPDFLTD